ncbi:MAG TPA: cell wall-binding repeat-containing protein, partial [Acidimicrobiales bacterium]
YAIASTGAVRWHNIGSDADCANQAFQSSFAIGDTTGDGLPDATIGALGLQSPSYNAISGVMNKGWPFFTDDTVFSSPALADLQGTGVPDIVMGGDATPGPGSFQGGMMRAITGSGQLLWEFKTDEQVRSSPAIGDITGSGTPSIVFGTGNFWLQHGGAVDSTYLFSLNPSGQLQWKRNLGAVTQSSPALADVAGTGHLDVVEGTSGTLANPNAGSIWVLDGNGNPLPNWGPRNSDGGVVIGGISTADLNGDGAQDLLVPTGAGVFIYDGRTAQQIGAIDTGLVSFQGTPLVTDDGGGAVGVTVAGTQPNGTGVVEHYRVAGGRLGSNNWPMFHHDPLHTGNTTTAPMACVPGPSPTPPTGKLSRIAGANRDATGVAVSQSSFPAAGSAKAVVVASDANYPDALAGGPLAVARGGPVLITPPSGLPASVDAEIRRVLPLGGTVDVLGGSAAVSPGVDTELSGEGYLVDRIAGADRFQTAVAIAAALGNPATVL